MLPTSVEIIRLPLFKDLYEPISTMECQPRVLLPLEQLSNEKRPGWLDYEGDYTTQLYSGIMINHFKDPY